MDIRTLAFAGIIILNSNPAVSGKIQKWIDQEGRVHFSEIVPNNVDSTELNPKITTTAPSSNNSLKKILRPGEKKMLKRYDQRGRRLVQAKRKELKKSAQKKKHLAQAKKKCSYHRQKKNSLESRLRNGYKPSEKSRIEEKLAKHNFSIREYCL